MTIGSTNEGEAIIAKGLAAGEQVVREGQFLLGPGSRVEVKDQTKLTGETKGEGKRSGRTEGGKRGNVKADEKKGES